MITTTYVGHACLLIQSKNCTMLTDPIWFDPHWEEINVLCPSIVLDFEKIPQVDILNISHIHMDHFDVRTLAYLRNSKILSPDVKVFAPPDEILLEIMGELDYADIEVVEPGKAHKIKDITLTFTPSILPWGEPPENGFIIDDGEVIIWNQVDSVVTPEVINNIKKSWGHIDLAHVRFETLLEGNFTFHRPLQLPFTEYQSFLQMVKMLNPKFILPGSAAFRYSDEFGFLNNLSFPTSPQQFLNDLSEFCPEVKRSPFAHGDVAEISSQGVEMRPQGSDFVRIDENDKSVVEFKPVASVPPIRTLAKDKVTHEEQRQDVIRFVEGDMLQRMLQNEMAEVWQHWKISYQLEVFGMDGVSDIWTVDFSKEPEMQKGRAGKINLYEGISCSELYGLVNQTANWDFISGSAQYRTFHNVYKIENESFFFYSQDKKLPQPLRVIFPNDREMKIEQFMKDVRRWKNKVHPVGVSVS
ncbi:MAG: MBL fold metallo-hydrolase [Nitrospinaceae bacterium]|nr:MBL fold metallo-hydrolase [Nitrospinaceae bacterium]|tara:strand:- start:730 stop:2139 length:1410 start_codon:yes stop_codon:yes gene_type:complete